MSRRRRGLIALSVLTGISAVAVYLLWPWEPVYEGKKLSYWVDRWVHEGHSHAESVLLQVGATNRNIWPQAIQKKRTIMIKALLTRDTILWKPFMRLKKQGPRWISRLLPDWPEPAETRLAAVNFFAQGDFRGDSFPSEAIPILFQIASRDQHLRIRSAAIAAIGNLGRSSEGAMPLLCSLAEGDPDPTIRSFAIQAMSRLDDPSSRAIPIMLKALNSNQLVDRECAAKWFGRTGLVPEKAVPELVHRLEDPGMKSDAAAALTKYGPRAQFAVPKLIQLANGSNRDVSSVAVWALLAIDRDAAAKAGIKSLDFQGHHMTQP